MLPIPKTLSAEERKERIYKSQTYSYYRDLLLGDTNENLELFFSASELNTEEKKDLLNKVVDRRERELVSSLIRSQNQKAIKTLLKSVLLSPDKKLSVLRSARIMLLGIGTHKKVNKENLFDTLMNSAIITEDEKDKIIFNLEQFGTREFMQIFKTISTIADIEELIKE